MKKLYSLKCIFILTVFVFSFSSSSNANWQKSDGKVKTPSTPYTQHTQYTPNTPHSASDSLPKGVTQDWLKDIRDENGKRINNKETGRAISEIPEDPEGDALQRKIFNGLVTGSYFGETLSNAGDVNGDGYDDIIVGAFNTITGSAYIYFGGLNMNTAPDIVLTGEPSVGNTFFGTSVSTAGDVNGDGYSDVIVGASLFNSSAGRAYIYLGGSSMNNVSDIVLTGEASNNSFGYAVSTAGDVNGDGYSDVIVGAYGYVSSTGRSYIFLGGASMNNTADLIITGAAVDNTFGGSVSTAGDVNADGYSDVIVGANNYSLSTGRAYIFFGGVSMNNIADVTMTGEAGNNFFGSSVSKAGDVNGDGYSDVIVGASGYVSNKGRSYVFFGGAAMNNISDVTMTGESAGSNFGISVSTAGDINGDGFSDIIVGTNSFSSGPGRAFVFFGGALMKNIPDADMTGESLSSSFGNSVSTAGDVNGDGYSDIIVGSYGFNATTGRVYLYDYFMKNEIIPEITLSGEAVSNDFGYSVSTAGDVNGDGYSDVIVGAPYYNSNTGRAYIFLGGASMNNIADVTMTGEAVNNYFGYSVSSAGDVNGDGYSDVIVGAYGYTSYTGRAYIFFGWSAMDYLPDLIMTGFAVNSSFGESISAEGDVNGDGYSDVIVSADDFLSGPGKAYVFLGGSSMNNIADVTMTGEAAGNNFGSSVSTAGDVNGDGYSDAIVGAGFYNSGTGRVYIFFGASSMNNVADVIITGEAASNYLGLSVSAAGDVNGDGYSDVIAGAYGYSSFIGRAYIFFGGSSMNNIADVTLTGESGANLGLSVSTAGDINGDGYSDVILGSYSYNSFTGRAYIFFGGYLMDNTADVTMTGETISSTFGRSVSAAGDINGDGYSDVIVGANFYNSNTGRSFIYKGSAISAKPILLYVKDVPNDQGGQISLKWARSSYDVTGVSAIVYYEVLRSNPPSGGNYAWESVVSVNAFRQPFYSYTDMTPFDSTSNTSGNFFYKIIAQTYFPGVFWESNILSGKSIDNIPPIAVQNFSAASAAGNILLNWDNNTEPDLHNYLIYRSTSPFIDPNLLTPYATVTTSSYTDTSPLSGLYYYFIVAQDIHYNKSPVATAASPNITLNLTMFIEGFYNSSTNLQISDTIKVYLRNISSPYAIADSAKAVIASNGNAQLLFGNAVSGTYYIMIKHRNTLETWSRSGGENLSKGVTVNYNLSNLIAQAFGNNIKQIDSSPVRFGIFSGDVNQDGNINLTDVISVYNNASLFLTGYKTTDVNGDNLTDLTDVIIANNNSIKFISVVKP